MEKYEPLKNYLKKVTDSSIALSFEQMEDIIGSPLPESARKHRAYFSNTRTHSISVAWLDAGFYVENIDYSRGIVSFKRQECFDKALLSADVFEQYLVSNKCLGNQSYVSIFSLFEVIKYRGHFEREVFDYIQKNHIHIVDGKGKNVLFSDFESSKLSIGNLLLNVYNSVVKYCLINCFYNAFKKHSLPSILNFFMEENEDNLLIDFPICYDPEVWALYFNKLLRLLKNKTQNDVFRMDTITEMFSQLDYQSMSLIILTGADNITYNYFNYHLKEFIKSCGEKTPFIPFTIINELLNISILVDNQKLIYQTSTDENFKILLGDTLNRVIKV